MIKNFRLRIRGIMGKKMTFQIGNYTRPLLTNPDIIIAERGAKSLTRKRVNR